MKQKSAKLALAVSMMALALGGCANTLRGGPERIYPLVQNAAENTRYEPLKTAINTHCYDIAKSQGNRETRNRLVGALMLLSDERYNEFELSLSNENRGANFAFSALSLGLTGAATLASESSAQTLAAIDTGLKGASQAYSKDFLFDQTIPALQNQMRASRARVRQRIYERRELPIDEWPMCWGLQDVIAYEQAGTLVGAIADITAVSSADKDQAESSANRVVKTSYRAGANKDILEAYLFNPDIDSSERQRRTGLGVQALQNANLGTTPGDLIVLVSGGSEAERSALIAALKSLEQSPTGLQALN